MDLPIKYSYEVLEVAVGRPRTCGESEGGKGARCNLIKKQTVSLAFFSWAKGRSG